MSLRQAGRTGSIPWTRVALILAAAIGGMPAGAATLFNQVHTIAAATTGVPVEETFSIATAGTYTITLTDLGAQLTPPAPLASVKLAVTDSSDKLVGTVLVGAGTLTLTSLPADTYELHVVGMPGNAPGSGPIGLTVDGSGMTQVAAFQATLALPSQALPNGEAVLDSSFTANSSGNYTVTLTDLALPQNLTTLTLLLIQQGGAPVATLPVAGTGALQTTVTLTQGVTYDVFAVGAAGAPANGGLFSAVVTDSGNIVVFGRAVPVGSTIQVGSPVLAAGSATLTLTDLKYPAALSALEAVAWIEGQTPVQLPAGGQTTFTAVSGTYSAFGYAAAAAAAPAAGSYAMQLTQGAQTSLSTARGVTAAGSGESAYDFDTAIATAGSYTLGLADFQFPAALTTLNLAAVQSGALLGTPLARAGSGSVTMAAGPASMLVFAQAPAAGGLFGIDLAPAAGGTSIFSTTQAVGTLFSVQQITVTAAGSYAVTATDLGFPANFGSYDTIVTQGTTPLGSIFGGGTFNFAATPGIYYVNFIAQPTGADAAGTFALTVATAPPPPTVSISVDRPQVTSGSMVDVIWSSQNATSCDATPAAGGFSGTQPLNGTFTSSALTSNTTFTLSCTGPGGTTSQSATVTIIASSGHGGGGALDAALIALLGGLLCLRALSLCAQRTRL